MNIAIASETEEIDGLVPATFKESPFLMIIDADKNQIFHVYGKQDPDNLVFAKKVVEHDCEAVICGPGPFGHSHDFSCECGEEEEHEH